MRMFFLAALLAWSLTSFGQAAAPVVVPTTKVSLVPPAGFVASGRFSGFEQAATGASIVVTEFNTPAGQMVAGMTESALATRGMKLVRKEAVKLRGGSGTLFQVTQQANGVAYQKQILVFGDKTVTAMATGTYPEKSADLAGAVKAALLTAVYNKKLPADTRPLTNFDVDVSGTGFKFARNMAGMVMYTTDGKAPTLAADKAVLVVSNSQGSAATGDRQQFSLTRLQQLPDGQNNKVRSISPITVHGLSGYEIVADGKSSQGEPQLVYQVSLFTDRGEYYLIVGLADNKATDRLPEFKLVAQTFKAL